MLDSGRESLKTLKSKPCTVHVRFWKSLNHVLYVLDSGSESLKTLKFKNKYCTQPSQNVSEEEVILRFEAVWLPSC